MTPDELDAIEAAWKDPYQHPNAVECPPVLIAALREAWAEATTEAEWWGERLGVATARFTAAEAERDRMRRGEVDGIFTSVVHECCSRAQAAEAALDRVRALCDVAQGHAPAIDAWVNVANVRAAIEGES